MEARGTVLKWAAVSGALDDLPLDALKLYLLLLVRAEAIGAESRMCLRTMQRVFGRASRGKSVSRHWRCWRRTTCSRGPPSYLAHRGGSGTHGEGRVSRSSSSSICRVREVVRLWVSDAPQSGRNAEGGETHGRPGIAAGRHEYRTDGHAQEEEKRPGSVAAPVLLSDRG
jgi:hypothetical protein